MIKSANIESLEIIALLHTLGAFLLIAFLVVHLYLITTGHTVTSNLKAMITGWEELEAEKRLRLRLKKKSMKAEVELRG
jgi:thiosulfate reductase cytochrome b subunit